MYQATHKGRYRIINAAKYRGNINEISYRSSWEFKFMRWCDSNPSVLEWGSETVIIPYRSPVDNNIHRYFVDFYIKIKDKDNKVLKYLTESNSEFKDAFLKYVDDYFLPIINGNITQEEEDYFFEEMDIVVDELEKILSQIFENIYK